MQLLHDFYTQPQKYSFVHAFNHLQVCLPRPLPPAATSFLPPSHSVAGSAGWVAAEEAQLGRLASAAEGS